MLVDEGFEVFWALDLQPCHVDGASAQDDALSLTEEHGQIVADGDPGVVLGAKLGLVVEKCLAPHGLALAGLPVELVTELEERLADTPVPLGGVFTTVVDVPGEGTVPEDEAAAKGHEAAEASAAGLFVGLADGAVGLDDLAGLGSHRIRSSYLSHEEGLEDLCLAAVVLAEAAVFGLLAIDLGPVGGEGLLAMIVEVALVAEPLDGLAFSVGGGATLVVGCLEDRQGILELGSVILVTVLSGVVGDDAKLHPLGQAVLTPGGSGSPVGIDGLWEPSVEVELSFDPADGGDVLLDGPVVGLDHEAGEVADLREKAGGNARSDPADVCEDVCVDGEAPDQPTEVFVEVPLQRCECLDAGMGRSYGVEAVGEADAIEPDCALGKDGADGGLVSALLGSFAGLLCLLPLAEDELQADDVGIGLSGLSEELRALFEERDEIEMVVFALVGEALGELPGRDDHDSSAFAQLARFLGHGPGQHATGATGHGDDGIASLDAVRLARDTSDDAGDLCPIFADRGGL